MSRLEWQWFLHGKRLMPGERIQVRAQGIWLTGLFVPLNEGTLPTLSTVCREGRPEGLAPLKGVEDLPSIPLSTEMELRRADGLDQEPSRLTLRARPGAPPTGLELESA